jgi:Ca-activated chloride channel family protein
MVYIPEVPMDSSMTSAGDSTMIAPGVAEGGATVVSRASGDATVVVSQPASSARGDSTVAVGRLATMDLSALQPRVEYNLRAHNTYALAGQNVQNYLLADIGAFFAGGLQARAPIALALAIDRSGSMEGRPIESVKTAVGLIVDQLTEADMLSIVTFGEKVEVLMPASRVLNRELIKQHVNRIQPKGTTNLFSGMGTAAEQLLAAKTPQHLSRTLLLTDGEANEGITEYADIVALARDLRGKGMSISTVGVGVEYNEELLSAVAKHTRGNYYYIDAIDRIPEVFDRELKDLFGTVATNVILRLKLSENVELARVYGHEAGKGSSGFGQTATIELPDLSTGEQLPVLIQLAVRPHQPARYRLVHSELEFKYFGQNERQTLKGDFIAEFTDDKDAILRGVDPVVEAAMRERDIAANLKRATAMLDSDVGTATMIIQQAQQQLSAAGKNEDATLVGTALMKIQRGNVDDATKTLSVAEFELNR